MSNTFRVMRNSALMLCSAFFLACENPTDISFGNGSLGATYFTDTLNLGIQTYLMDSATTSNQAAALVGSYHDPLFGQITSVAYLQPTIQQKTNPFTGNLDIVPFDIQDNQVYDSLVIRLVNKDNLIFGDSTAQMTLNVHRLTEELPTQNYNYDSEVAFDPEPIASVTIDRSSLRDANDSIPEWIRIRLPDSIGEELKKIEGTETASDLDAFGKAFKGFVITATDANAINVFNIGFTSTSSNSSLVYYVHEVGATEALTYQFEFTSGRFNKVSTDRSGTLLAELLSKTSGIDISETGDRSFIQGGTGLANLINFPGVKELGKIEVKRAELTFKADSTTFSTQYPRAPFVTFIEMNGNKIKRLNGDYSYVNSTLGSNSGILSTYVDSTNTWIADITPYLQDITLNNRNDDGLALVAAIPTTTTSSALVFNTGFNRMVLRNFKLNLYYSK